MKRSILAFTLVSIGLGLGGCSDKGVAIWQEKKAPDEFAVYSRAPLSLPPSYGLRPPQPGMTRPQDTLTRDQSRKILLGGAASVQSGPAGKGEMLLRRSAGALSNDPDIRATVNQESITMAADSRTMSERIIFWGTPTPFGTIVDAPKEARRIRENQALGRPLTEGETPTIKRKKKALLEGLFE